MVLLGCTPKGRVTEQHDVFFGIGTQLKDLIPNMKAFWPEGIDLHIDAWREISVVDGFSVEVVEKAAEASDENNLYFLNLGGYREDEFEEFHYKMLSVSANITTAIKKSKKTAFYKHSGFKGADSHIDEKYGIDVDDMHKVGDLLSAEDRLKYKLKFSELAQPHEEDKLHLGYLIFKKL